MNNEKYTVYGMALSGNCHKVKTILDLSKASYSWIDTDTRVQATRTPEYRAKNPNGEVPLLELPDGRFLPESNAILFYLSQDTPYWPANDDAYAQAQVMRWMFFEQYSHEPYIAVNRARLAIFKTERPDDAAVRSRHEKGRKTLGVMNEHLRDNDFFATKNISIADIALFAYTHVAHEGGFDLNEFSEVQAWLERLLDHGFSKMPPI
ncbi:MAG: glutathione S-transferase family protein [bacterium]|nr:glutathione S-transferase family protein [bacterium]